MDFMNGQTITQAYLHDAEHLVLRTKECTYILYAAQSCCSYSWWTDLETPLETRKGTPRKRPAVVRMFSISGDHSTEHPDAKHGTYDTTFLAIRTDVGDITATVHNDRGNGYYGGHVQVYRVLDGEAHKLAVGYKDREWEPVDSRCRKTWLEIANRPIIADAPAPTGG